MKLELEVSWQLRVEVVLVRQRAEEPLARLHVTCPALPVTAILEKDFWTACSGCHCTRWWGQNQNCHWLVSQGGDCGESIAVCRKAACLGRTFLPPCPSESSVSHFRGITLWVLSGPVSSAADSWALWLLLLLWELALVISTNAAMWRAK